MANPARLFAALFEDLTHLPLALAPNTLLSFGTAHRPSDHAASTTAARGHQEERPDFRKKIDYYTEHATRVGGRKRRGSTTRPPVSGSPNSNEIRQWAVEAGYEVPARGRLPQSLVDEYTAAH